MLSWDVMAADDEAMRAFAAVSSSSATSPAKEMDSSSRGVNGQG